MNQIIYIFIQLFVTLFFSTVCVNYFLSLYRKTQRTKKVFLFLHILKIITLAAVFTVIVYFAGNLQIREPGTPRIFLFTFIGIFAEIGLFSYLYPNANTKELVFIYTLVSSVTNFFMVSTMGLLTSFFGREFLSQFSDVSKVVFQVFATVLSAFLTGVAITICKKTKARKCFGRILSYDNFCLIVGVLLFLVENGFILLLQTSLAFLGLKGVVKDFVPLLHFVPYLMLLFFFFLITKEQKQIRIIQKAEAVALQQRGHLKRLEKVQEKLKVVQEDY